MSNTTDGRFPPVRSTGGRPKKRKVPVSEVYPYDSEVSTPEQVQQYNENLFTELLNGCQIVCIIDQNNQEMQIPMLDLLQDMYLEIKRLKRLVGE